ncbi:MAG: hypothetical protein RLZZ450_680 [Pseudomonadota bacterium]
MGRKRKDTDYVSIVEASYQAVDSDEEWLAQLLDIARPVLDLGGGLGLSLVQEGPEARQIALSQGVGPLRDMLRLSWPAIRQLDEPTYREFFYPGTPVLLASQLVAGFAEHLQHAFRSLMQFAGANDLLGMLGYPAPGWAFAMFVAVGDAPLTPLVRGTLRRVRIHIEAGLRLRMFCSGEAVAVIRPDGRLEHMDSHALGRSACTLLEAQATAIERARSPKERAHPHRAVAVWQALVEGRWSVVERVDSDGRRHYHAFENAPHVHALRALSGTEALVCALSLQGLVGKEVAYTTGLSQSSVSAALGAAAERLGFADRSELLRVGARLLDAGPGPLAAALTAAEQEVMRLVRRGLSNREIAAARDTSTNTVANQLRALLRKTGVSSRRGLLLADP